MDNHQASFTNTPKVSFDDELFRAMDPGKFQDHVNRILEQYIDHSLEVDEFHLSMTLNTDDFATSLDKWLGFAVEKGVKVVRIALREGSFSSYTLPLDVLKAESLVKLVVERCKFPELLDETLILCKNLRVLRLSSIPNLDEELLHCLLAACSSISELKICDSEDELNNIRVMKLPCLKRLHIAEGYGSETRSIEIDAPSLETIVLRLMHCQCSLMFHPSPNLKALEMENASIKNEFFGSLKEKFPGLQCLSLIACYGYEKIELTSLSLKHLLLNSSSETLKEMVIDAPCMALFEYYDVGAKTVPKISFRPLSGKLEYHVAVINDHMRLYEIKSA